MQSSKNDWDETYPSGTFVASAANAPGSLCNQAEVQLVDETKQEMVFEAVQTFL